MPLFPSQEWMSEFCRKLAADPRAAQVASGLDGDYRFVVEPGGPLAVEQRFSVTIRPDSDGPRIEPRSESADEPRLTLTAGYPVWRQLIGGQLDAMMAVMTGRLRASGDLSGLMGQFSALQPLVDALRGIETEWLT